MSLTVACLVMAAGRATRFGSPKQLARLGEGTLLQHTISGLEPLFGDKLHVVLGNQSDDIASSLPGHIRTLRVTGWEAGLGHSIAGAVKMLLAGKAPDGIMIALADQVGITRADYKILLDAFDGRQIVAARYAGKTRVPAIFPASRFAQLSTLSGDQGARDILGAPDTQTTCIDLPGGLFDIDTPEDLAHWKERTHEH